jgi:hypothetical protein
MDDVASHLQTTIQDPKYKHILAELINSDLIQINSSKIINLASSIEKATTEYFNSLSPFLVKFHHVEFDLWGNTWGQIDGKDIVFNQSLDGQGTISFYRPDEMSVRDINCFLIWHAQKHMSCPNTITTPSSDLRILMSIFRYKALKNKMCHLCSNHQSSFWGFVIILGTVKPLNFLQVVEPPCEVLTDIDTE